MYRELWVILAHLEGKLELSISTTCFLMLSKERRVYQQAGWVMKS
jgi:hypothetical protein